jgi:hypothetical protein
MAVHGVVVVLLGGGVFLHDVGEGAMPHPRRYLPHHHNATETRNRDTTAGMRAGGGCEGAYQKAGCMN